MVFEPNVIPARIVIGVTGHRHLEAKPWLIEEIQEAILKIREMIPAGIKTPIQLTVLSPLAEGADRLVAEEVLKLPGTTLKVVLPVEKNDYMRDFETAESKAEFAGLISRAESIDILTVANSRDEAYEQVGHYVVDQCDVLITLWDGKSSAGRGGTEEIVDYARSRGCPLIWIHSGKPGKITFEARPCPEEVS